MKTRRSARPASVLLFAALGVTVAADDGVTVTKHVDRLTATAGDPLTYTVTIAHTDDPDIATGLFEDDFPASLTSCTWTCAATGPGWCEQDSGAGDIFQLVWVPLGETATIEASCTFAPSAEELSVGNTASFQTMDPDTFNQSTVITWNEAWLVFADGFESGGWSSWSEVMP